MKERAFRWDLANSLEEQEGAENPHQVFHPEIRLVAPLLACSVQIALIAGDVSEKK
jgi:hypothetical protein